MKIINLRKKKKTKKTAASEDRIPLERLGHKPMKTNGIPAATSVVTMNNPAVIPLPNREPTGTIVEIFKNPTLGRSIVHMLGWFSFIFRFYIAHSRSKKLRGKMSEVERIRGLAKRLRVMFENMGPTTIKVGQQLAVRSDVIPVEYCDELENLLDSAPSIPTEQAIEIIEQETGKPLEETFSEFDRNCFGSASLACVYRARLISGEWVAVKVRRPGVEQEILADCQALSTIFTLAENIGITRLGKWLAVITETRSMLLDELDFKLESWQAIYFKSLIKEIKHFNVPKTYSHLCTRKLIVSEFISGMTMRMILNVLEGNDIAAIHKLTAEGYNPLKLGKRWANYVYWANFDSPIFHADPHPGNIIVKPGNKLYMIDFGCCGSVANSIRRLMLNLNIAFSEGDLEQAVNGIIAMNEPLPPLDIEAYQTDLRNLIRKQYILSQQKHAAWKEKSLASGMRESTEIARKFNIPVQSALLRFFRMQTLSDSMLFRLNPNFNATKQVMKWHAKRQNERSKRARKQIENKLHGGIDWLHIEQQQAQQAQVQRQIQASSEIPKFRFRFGVSKGHYAVTVLITAAVRLLVLVGVFFILKTGCHMLWSMLRDSLSAVTLKDVFIKTFSFDISYFFLFGFLSFIVGIAVQKIRIREREVDIPRREN